MRSAASGQTWERVGALTGVVFVVVLLVSIFLPGMPPQIDDHADKVASYFVDNDSAIQVANYLSGIAAFFFIWFLASLRSALLRAEGDRPRLAPVVLAAGAATVPLALVTNVTNNVLATGTAGSGDPNLVEALYRLGVYVGTFPFFTIALLVAATSIVSLRTGLFPKWLTWGGYALVPWFLAVGGTGLIVDSGAFSATGECGFLGLLVWLVWVAAISFVLASRAGGAVPLSQARPD